MQRPKLAFDAESRHRLTVAEEEYYHRNPRLPRVMDLVDTVESWGDFIEFLEEGRMQFNADEVLSFLSLRSNIDERLSVAEKTEPRSACELRTAVEALDRLYSALLEPLPRGQRLRLVPATPWHGDPVRAAFLRGVPRSLAPEEKAALVRACSSPGNSDAES